MRNLTPVQKTYYRWLLERVMVNCWTTLKCAKEIKAKPKDVLADLKDAIEYDKQGLLYRKDEPKREKFKRK